MTIRQRGKSFEAYVQVNGNRKRMSFSTNEEATLWEAQARYNMQNGLLAPAGINSVGVVTACWTLGKALDEAYEQLWEGRKNEKSNESMMRLLTDWFGRKTPVNKIDAELWKDYKRYMQKRGRAGSTINRHKSCLLSALKMAKESKQLSELPVLRGGKESTPEVKWYRPHEVDLILKTFKDMGKDYLHDMAILSVDTGMRASEILKFDPTPIPIGNKWGMMIPDRKNGDPLLLPVTSRVLEVCERTEFTKHPKQFRRQWDMLRNITDRPDFIWKTFRSTCCSRLVQGGMDIFRVKEWMGHRNIQTTMKYAYLAPEGLLEGVDILEGK